MLEDLQGDLRQFFFNSCISRFTSDFEHTFMDKRIFIKVDTSLLQSISVFRIPVILLKWHSATLNIKIMENQRKSKN